MIMFKSSKRHVRISFQILADKWGLSFACVPSFFISFIHSLNTVPDRCHYGALRGLRCIKATPATNSHTYMSSTSLWAMGTTFVSRGSDSVRQWLRAWTLLADSLASGPSSATHQLCEPGQLTRSSQATVPHLSSLGSSIL